MGEGNKARRLIANLAGGRWTDSTLALAGDLARLMDDMVTRSVAGARSIGLVPDALDQYWQHTLRIPENRPAMFWPTYLANAYDKIEPRSGAIC